MHVRPDPESCPTRTPSASIGLALCETPRDLTPVDFGQRKAVQQHVSDIFGVEAHLVVIWRGQLGSHQRDQSDLAEGSRAAGCQLEIENLRRNVLDSALLTQLLENWRETPLDRP